MKEKKSLRKTFLIAWGILLVYYFLSVIVFTYFYTKAPNKLNPWPNELYPIYVLESLYWRTFRICWWWTLIARFIEFILFYLCTIFIAFTSYQKLFKIHFLKLCFAFSLGIVASFLITKTSFFGDWYTDYGLAPYVVGPYLFIIYSIIISLIWLPQTYLLLFSLYFTYKAVINKDVKFAIIVDNTIKYPDKFSHIFLQVLFLVAVPHFSHGVGFIIGPFFNFMPPASQWLMVVFGSAYLATIGISMLYIANQLYDISFQVKDERNVRGKA